MTSLKFKTSIKCSGCINKVTPFLNGEEGIEKWEVDIYNPQKTLTIESENITSERIVELVEKAGFTIEKI